VKITMIGSCFAGFLKEPLAALADSPDYAHIQPIEFQTHTVWQRVDAVVDIINDNIPDQHLIRYYIDKGHWGVQPPEKNSEWFAREILAQNRNALQLVHDQPDLLIFDSLSDCDIPYTDIRDLAGNVSLGEYFLINTILRRNLMRSSSLSNFLH
jgi:hypothetical protein